MSEINEGELAELERAKLLRIAQELGVVYQADGHGDYPGPVDAMVEEIRRLRGGDRSADLYAADMQAIIRVMNECNFPHHPEYPNDDEIIRRLYEEGWTRMEAQKESAELRAEVERLRAALRRVAEELQPCDAAFAGEDFADVPTYVATALGISRAALDAEEHAT